MVRHHDMPVFISSIVSSIISSISVSSILHGFFGFAKSSLPSVPMCQRPLAEQTLHFPIEL